MCGVVNDKAAETAGPNNRRAGAIAESGVLACVSLRFSRNTYRARVSLTRAQVVAEAGFDIRLSPEMPMAEMSALLDQWTEEEGLSWKFVPYSLSSFASQTCMHERRSID